MDLDLGLLRAMYSEDPLAFSRSGLTTDLIAPEYRKVFDEFFLHFNTYGKYPAVEFLNARFSVDIRRAPVSPFNFFVDQIFRRHEYNTLINTMMKTKAILDSDPLRSKEAVEIWANVIGKLTLGRQGIQIVKTISNDEFEDYLTHTKQVIPTPWLSFNDRLGGGFRTEEVTTVVARPGIGKTFWLLLCLVQAVSKQKLRAMLVNTEMSKEAILTREWSMLTGVPISSFRAKRFMSFEQSKLDSLFKGVGEKCELLMMGEGFNVDINSIDVAITALKPAIVGIDAAYLLKIPERVRDKYERVALIFERLKGMAKRHKIPFIVTSQMNRDSGNKGYSQERVAYSDEISRLSDNVIFLTQEDNKTELTMKMVKLREGHDYSDIPLFWNISEGNYEERNPPVRTDDPNA